MTPALMLADLTRAEVAEAVNAVLVMPFGAIEQHGPHLPFGTDFVIVDAVARGAGERAGRDAPVICAPTMAYGSSEHHLTVGGALSLAARTFESCVRDLLASAAASGFRRVFVVNGHGGNELLLRIAAEATVGGRPLVVGGGAYWSLARTGLERILPEPSAIPGHAGRFETSLMLALQRDRKFARTVRDDWRPESETAYWRADGRRWELIDGYTDNPADATVEEGEACLSAITAAVADCIVEFERSSERPAVR